jgi:hypothetical protein
MHIIVFTQLYYTKTLKTFTCFDPCGIVIRESERQMILYKTLMYVWVTFGDQPV